MTSRVLRGLDDVAVEFARLLAIATDGDVRPADNLHPRDPLPAQQHGERQRGPMREGARREDRHVHPAVVGLGIREQHDATLQAPDIADQHRAGVTPQGVLAVDRHLHPHRAPEQMWNSGDHIGQRADPRLECRGRTVHHGGVEAHPGHHGEQFAVHLTEIHLTAAARHCHPDTLDRVQWQTEVGGQQVSGAGRQHGQGGSGAGEPRKSGPHRAITARHEHHFRARFDRASRLPGAGVFRCGLQPVRRRPPGRGQRRIDDVAKLGQLLHPGRVDDDRRPQRADRRPGLRRHIRCLHVASVTE